MSDPFRPIDPAHLETAEREAFQTEREKFRRDNLERLRRQFRPHEITFIDSDGVERTRTTGFQCIPSDNPARGNKIAADLSNMGENPEILPFDIPDPSSTDMKELDRDIVRLGHCENIIHAAPVPETGPEFESMDEEAILSYMEKFIDQKCGPGNLHPHLKDLKDLKDLKGQDQKNG